MRSIDVHRIVTIEAPEPIFRPVALGDRTIHLTGAIPAPGSELSQDFEIPAGRGTTAPLRRDVLFGALCFVSTLPNIQKHACIAQIAHLHEHCKVEFPAVAVHHVSADSVSHWRELDIYHPEVTACGYSLAEADPLDAQAFKQAFGVGVNESHRIAHGLFALENGRFLASEVPDNQLRSANVDAFLSRLRAALASR
jgi:Zn ribbon nucleic-acid-binding protein